jgi:hypothetical protein
MALEFARHVKSKYLIALVLVLVGTNLFTFASTRYWTTKYVLAQAQERMDAALRKEGLYEQVYPSDRPLSVPIALAICQAGGSYYWWNDGLIFWGVGAVLTLSGMAVTLYKPRKMQTG